MSPDIPPQAIDAEKALLGCLLIDPAAADAIAGQIAESDLYHEVHRLVWRAYHTLQRSGSPTDDSVLLAKALAATGDVDDPAVLLLELLQAVPHAAHVRYYASLVRDAADRRRLISACTEGVKKANDPSADVPAVVATVEGELHAILEHAATATETAADVTMRVMLAMESDEPPGLPTGFLGLDDKLSGGFGPGRLYVLAARPSIGKTALAISSTLRISEAGHRVLFATAEQSSDELTERLLSMVSMVPLSVIHRRQFGSADRQRITDAANIVANLPVHFDDAGKKTVSQIAAAARLQQRRGNLDVVVVDYLQLLQPEDAKANRETQVASMSRGLKQLARELDVPVVCLAQLNRAVETRDNKRPRLSDLRESGAIEQDADVVVFLDRARTREDGDIHKASLIVAKNRHGETGDVALSFDPPTMRFRDAEGYGF